MRQKNKKEKECKHSFVKYPPRIGKLKVCKKCGFLWVLGDVKFGEHSIKLSGAGNYIETSTTTAPANPASGKIRLYATGGTSLKIKDSAGTETDLAAPGGDLYNFLTNPGLEIWQRGAGAFTADNAYTADRWLFSLGAGGSVSVTRSGVGEADTVADTDSKYACKIVYTFGTGAAIFKQVIAADEDAYQLRGRALTLRLRIRTATASAVRVRIIDNVGNGTYSSYHTGGSTFESLDASRTIAATATSVTVEVSVEATSTVYVDNATLIIGSTAQTYYPLHPAEEWERCQRYYWETSGVTLFPQVTGNATANGQTWTTNILLPTPMAVAPTVTKAGTWEVSNTAQPTVDAPAVEGFRLNATSSASGFLYTRPDSSDDTVTAEANP